MLFEFKKRIKSLTICLILIGIFLFFTADLFPANSIGNSPESQIVIIFEIGASGGEKINLSIDSLFIGRDNDRISLLERPRKLNSKQMAGDQILLTEKLLAPGNYHDIIIYFGMAEIIVDGEMAQLRTSPDGVKVDVELNIESGTTQSLFLEWLPQSTAPDDFAYAVDLKIKHPEIPPPGSLLFVTNEKSDNISVFNRFNNRLVGVIKTGRGPRGMVYSKFNHQLYVANAADNTIIVINVPTMQVTRTIDLNYGDEPSRLAMSPDEQQLYVLNFGSNSLVVYDLPAFQEIDRQIIGPEPVGMGVDQSFVYISSRLSDEITIYDPVNRTLSIPMKINSTPGEIYICADENLIYLAADDYRTLTIFDTQNRASLASINLCSVVTGLAYGSTSNLLYAALRDCQEVDIIKVEEELIFGRIALPGQPGQITLEPENRRLFVTLVDQNAVAIINVNSQKIVDIIDVGQSPYMITVPY